MNPFYLYSAIAASLVGLYVAWQSGHLSKLKTVLNRKSTIEPPKASEGWPDTLQPTDEPALFEKVLRERTHGCTDAFILQAMREKWSPGEAMSQLLKQSHGEEPGDVQAKGSQGIREAGK